MTQTIFLYRYPLW